MTPGVETYKCLLVEIFSYSFDSDMTNSTYGHAVAHCDSTNSDKYR